MSNKGNQRSKPIPFVKKEKSTKLALNTPMATELAQEPLLGNYLRVFLGTSNDKIRRELTVHRPIGETDLAKDDWVATPSGEVPILLSRRKNPYVAQISAARQEYLESVLVQEGLLIEDAAGNVTLPCGKSRAAYHAEIKTAWAASNPPKDQKYDFERELSRSIGEAAREETEVRNRLTALGPGADTKFVSTFRTRSGPNSDQDQVALKWAKGLPLSAVADTILKHGISGPPVRPGMDETGVATGAVKAPPVAKDPTGNPNQWCFLPPDLPKKEKKDARDALAKAKAIFDGLGIDVQIIARPVDK
jgi:hypothetical protein